MSYNYYRSAAPTTWGTNNFEFVSPPVPQFHPQPSWSGLDYYRAHALSPDLSLYNHAWNRLSQQSGVGGVGLREADRLHRFAYGGFGEVQTMKPYEIGHAAAYEAYRTWTYHSSMYEPISADRSRQREALVGLSVAEVSRLWSYTGRMLDGYSLREACEAAAATASNLFRAFLGEGMMDASYGAHPGLHHSRSFSNLGYPIEDYAYDDEEARRRRHRDRRHSSSSRSRPILPDYTTPTSAIPMPNSAGYIPTYGGSSPYPGGSPYGGVPMGGGSPYGGVPMGGASPYGVPQSYVSSSSYPVQYGQALSAGSYTQPLVYGQGIPSSQGSTLIIQQPQSSHSSKHRHHRRHSSHRHRSHSDAGHITPPYGYHY